MLLRKGSLFLAYCMFSDLSFRDNSHMPQRGIISYFVKYSIRGRMKDESSKPERIQRSSSFPDEIGNIQILQELVHWCISAKLINRAATTTTPYATTRIGDPVIFNASKP